MPADAPHWVFQTGQLAPKTEPKRLGHFITGYLPTEKIPHSFQEVEKVLRRETAAVLPEDLNQHLSFRQLNWSLMYHPEAMDILFVGTQRPSDQTTTLPEAMGTVYIERNRSTQDDRVFVMDIGVAGIGATSTGENRVLAVTYSGYSHLADRLDISVPETELVSATGDALGKAQRIPNMPGGAFYTAGLVTKMMTERTGHDKIIRAHDARRSGNDLDWSDFPFRDEAENLGFKLEGWGSSWKITHERLNPETSRKEKWEVKVPAMMDVNPHS